MWIDERNGKKSNVSYFDVEKKRHTELENIRNIADEFDPRLNPVIIYVEEGTAAYIGGSLKTYKNIKNIYSKMWSFEDVVHEVKLTDMDNV